MTPDDLAKAGTESAIQQALFCWASHPEQRRKYPLLRWLYHVPNGGSRGDSAQTRKITGGTLKAEGVKSGVPDLDFPVRSSYGHPGMRIEMKVPAERNRIRGGCSEAQVEWLEFLRSQGYATVVCYTWREAANSLLAYMGSEERLVE